MDVLLLDSGYSPTCRRPCIRAQQPQHEIHVLDRLQPGERVVEQVARRVGVLLEDLVPALVVLEVRRRLGVVVDVRELPVGVVRITW
jgi:hypothetical protein